MRTPALARWLTMWPAFAYLTLWMFIGGNIAAAAFKASVKSPESEALMKDIMNMMGDDSWKACEGIKMRNAMNFVTGAWATDADIGACESCMIGVFTNEPVQRLTMTLLKWESVHHRNPATGRQMQNMRREKANGKATTEPADVPEPVAIQLVKSKAVSECLRLGAQVSRLEYLK